MIDHTICGRFVGPQFQAFPYRSVEILYLRNSYLVTGEEERLLAYQNIRGGNTRCRTSLLFHLSRYRLERSQHVDALLAYQNIRGWTVSAALLLVFMLVSSTGGVFYS